MKILPLLGFAAVAMACDAAQAPTAPHTLIAPSTSNASVVFNSRTELTIFAQDNCNGGGVEVQATFHDLFVLTFDDAGGVHAKAHENVTGQATNPVTGVAYVFNQTLDQVFDAR